MQQNGNIEKAEDADDKYNNSIENGDSDMQTEVTNLNANNDNSKLNVSITNDIDIDALLARPYADGVPTAFSEGLFSRFSDGWGFGKDKIHETGNPDTFGLPVTVKVNDKSVLPTVATWMPSHVLSIYDSDINYVNIAAEATVSASFTSQYDKNGIAHLTDGIISYADEPRNRWSNYSNPIRTQNETITFDFGKCDENNAVPNGVTVEEKKFITDNDLVVSYLTFKNQSDSTVTFELSTSPNRGLNEEKLGYRYILFGGNIGGTVKSFSLNAGQSVEYRLVLAVSDKKGESQNKISSFLADDDPVSKHISQFNLWFKKNIPYFDCDDEQLLQIYYFRWLTYRNNIREITADWNGYIISEFLPNVEWSGLYNSISCPAGHHFYEGRWIREGKYLDCYQEFWFIDGANPRLYSFPIADAYYNRYLVTGDKSELTKYLDKLCKNYEGWEKSHYVSSMGLYTQIADRDGMENGIGGDGIRTTINSYMYGDAMAIYNIAIMLGNTSLANEYKAKADKLRTNVMTKLWNEKEAFFETINENGDFVNVRELIGYVPWYFNLPYDDTKYSNSFSQLLDSNGFLAEYGPTTAEQRDSAFMSKLRPGCRWDGPSWPFATAQTLVASANLLNNYKNNNAYDKGDWFDLLKTYTKSQYKNGYPWVAENIHPITGEWIVDYDRSIHYNHSSYTDLVITGLAGLRPEDNNNYVTVNPLLEKGDLKYFMLENISYRGHDITIVYDESGTHYNIGTGLFIYVDGTLSASSKTITALKVSLK